MKKFGILFAALATFTTAFGCWYKFYNYEDYIYAINNREVHTQNVIVSEEDKNVYYTIKNNMIVDFPISVSVKLVSNEAVRLNNNNGRDTTITNKPEIISCALQYRVLPAGNWITVQKYETPTGTIPSSYPPNFYFGRNNIYPKCKPGDVIMIRVYVTDGIWQSGDASSMCTNKLEFINNAVTGATTADEKCKSLRDSYILTLSNGAKDIDLGGNWAPNLVTTVIWSGKTRAEK